MSKGRILFGAIAFVLLLSVGLSAQTKCMFIASTDPLTAGDQIVFDKFVEWGYDVTAVLSSDLAFFTEADYADYDFLFTSESVGSGSLEPLKEIPKPLLCSEGWASKPSALAWSDPASSDNYVPEPIVIVDDTGHPLAAGYNSGDVLDLCSDPAGLIVPHQPTIDIIPIAALASDPSFMLVYGVEAGTVNTLGLITKNRAAMVAIHEFG
jgi:hypothetical protein